MLALASVSVLYLTQSPLRDLLRHPNSHTSHSVFQIDFRRDKNKILDYQKATLPASAFWERLAGLPRNSQLIAAAPFYFESYHWDGPRWERRSQQRVVPAFLDGFCANNRNGEVADSGRFPLHNAYWLSRLESGSDKIPDWLVFTNPIPRFSGTPEGNEMRSEAEGCLQRLKQRLGTPDFQDDVLQAWRLPR